MAQNPYLLAADNHPSLLPILRSNPVLASQQDEHGYSLIHAAASYNYLDLLRILLSEFNVNVNLRDEDNETALFVVETVEAAKVLVEEFHIDVSAKNSDGLTAREKIIEEAEYPTVGDYLQSIESGRSTNGIDGAHSNELPAVPDGMTVTMSTMTPGEENEVEIDPEFRRRIEQLSEREDFHTESGQAELRQLVQDAIADRNLAERHVRPRQS